MAAVAAAEAAPSLAAMPPEVLLALLRFAGPRAAACAACACVRLRDAQREVAAAPVASFSSALVRMAAAGSPVAQASAAAAEATKIALDGLQSFSGGGGAFALVLCSPAAGAAPRQSLAAALEAALANLPAGVPALGVTGATVWGPEFTTAGGKGRTPRDVPRAVSVLLARVPGCHVATTTDGTYPDLGAGPVAAADPRLAAWLGASADASSLAFCALFLAPRRQPPFEASPHVSRAWPGAALVGGVASARGGAGAVATAERAPGAAKPDVRPCRDAAALSVFARAGGRAPRTAAHATRGLRPCGAVWAVSTLVRAAAPADAPGDDPGALVPFLLRSGSLVAAPPADTEAAAFDSESLWHDVFVTSFELQAAAFVRVWVAGATPAEDAAARAAARAVPAECAQDGAVADAEVLLWVPPGLFTAALAEGRLRCQVLRVDADAAAEDAAATAARLAQAVGAPGRPAAALAAACSARGAFLFRSEGEEARALAGPFPGAFIGLTVDGELGPPPEGGAPMLQSFTTTAAALSA